MIFGACSVIHLFRTVLEPWTALKLFILQLLFILYRTVLYAIERLTRTLAIDFLVIDLTVRYLCSSHLLYTIQVSDLPPHDGVQNVV